MTAAFNWIYENLRNFMIPVCLLCVLRTVICTLEMGRIRHLREKKDRFLSAANQIKEIGAEIGVFIGDVIANLVPRLWFITLPLTVVLGVVGYRMATKKAQFSDDYWREVGKERMRLKGDALETTEAPALESGIGGIMNAAMDYAAEDEPAEENPAADEVAKPEAVDAGFAPENEENEENNV